MSESSKMGLFGSKDETKETKKESKDNSPDRYAPYCIDSDSETYDTEALSIMDINDIIGVQSEPVSDSTLESEIAALSQMITESKPDGGFNTIGSKFNKMQEKCDGKLDTVITGEHGDMASMSDKINDTKVASMEFKKISVVKTSDNMELDNELVKQEDLSASDQSEYNDVKEHSKSNILKGNVLKNIECPNVLTKVNAHCNQTAGGSTSVTFKIGKCEKNVNKFRVSEEITNTGGTTAAISERTVFGNEQSISGSLQLIGEAYSSDDSQESIVNSEELKDVNLVHSSNEDSIPCKEGNDTSLNDKSVQDVNRVPDHCSGKDIEDTPSEEISTFQLELSNMNQLPVRTEDAKDVLDKTSSSSNITLEIKKEDTNTSTSKGDITESILEENKINVPIIEETEIVASNENKIDGHDEESTAVAFDTRNKEWKGEEIEKSMETVKDERTEECVSIGKESTHESNNPAIKVQVISEDGDKDIDALGAKIDIDNSKEVSVEKDMLVESIQPIVESRNIDDPPVQETDHDEKKQTKPGESSSNQLSPKTNEQTSVASNEIHTLSRGNIVTALLETDCLKADVQAEDMEKLDSVSTEVAKDKMKDSIVESDTTQPFINQGKSENSSKSPTSIHPDTTIQSELVLDAEQNVELTMSTSESTQVIDKTMLTDFTVEKDTEGNIDQSLKNNDEKPEEMEVEYMDTSEYESKLSEKMVNVNEDDITIKENEEEAGIQEQMETKSTSKEPTEKIAIVENEADDNVKVKDQTKDETIVEESTNDMAVIEEPKGSKIVEEDLRNSTDVDEEQTGITIMIDQVAKEKNIVKEAVNDDIIVDIQTETNVRITEEMETNITDQEDIQAVCKINDPSEPTIGETIEDKSIAEEPTQETMIIKQIVEDVDMKEEPPENRVVIEEPTEKSSVIEEFSDNKTALKESIENVLEIKETTEVSIVEKTIEDDAAVEEVTGYKISVEEPMKDNIDNEESSKDKVTVEDSIKDKVIVEELAVIDVTIELPKVEDAVKDKIVVEKPTEEKPFIKEPEKDTIIAEEVVQDTVAMQNPVQHEMIKENPVEDTIIAEEPEKDKIAIEEPRENAIVMEESVEDTIVIEESTKATVIIEEPMECISTSEDSIEDQAISDQPREDKIITDEPSKDLVLGNEVKEDKDIPDELMEEKGIVEESTERSNDIPVEEAIEVDSRIVESMDKQGISEEPTNIEMVTKEQIEEEHVNPTETKETIAVEEQKEEDEDEDMDRFNLEEKQLIEMKDDIKETEDNKRSCTMTTKSSLEESDEKIVPVEEIINHANENVSSHLFSSSSENVVLAKNDMKDKYMEEEMNLSMEPEKIETLLQVNKNDTVESPKTEKAMELSEEDTSVHKRSLESSEINDDIPESLDVNAEESVSMDVNEIESIEPSNDSELRNKQLLENSLKEEPDKETLKDIVENVNSVEGIFSEQSQNTQDIVTSILDDVNNESDFKHVLNAESGVVSEIEEVLQQSETVPLIESEMEELTEKLPQDSEDILSKDIEDTISNQNVDSLEGLLGLDLIPEGDDSTLKSTKTVEVNSKSEQLENVVDVSLLLEANHSSDMKQPADYKTHVISDCLTDRNSMSLKQEDDPMKTKDDEVNQSESDDMLKIDEVIIPNDEEREEDKDELRKNLKIDLPGNELDMDFDDTQLESVDSIEETEPKLELTTDILLHNAQQSDNLNDIASGVETSQPSSEISELESAVKFLQESEEQAIDSPLVLSPKMVESVVDDMSKDTVASSLFVCDEQICENTTELEAELQSIETDSISISEAEIISEAAKLESERKLAEQIKIDTSSNNFKMDDQREEENKEIIEEKILVTTVPESKFTAENLQNLVVQQTPNLKLEKVSETISSLPQKVLKTSELIPKVSILEERLKEPPKIEIPFTDITKISMSPTTSKDSLLIQKDVKLIAYQKMLESPKLLDKSEPKIVETPRKDSEKHDFENVGSPRIILKIAKSAITDCGEPRSPKSPKIRSATNSPNPEDSPGQKLGKIKLKLSKSGHPSIISNENIEEIGQWYSESSSSLSPLGMKIKLSKSGDASIVSSEKYETPDDLKEGKRTESPIGMKIKLSKFGDASIVQQDNKELQMKHKDKLEMVQGSPKRTESPIGMKFKLSKSGDASIIQPERQDILEEYKDNSSVKLKEKNETCYDSPKRTDSPIGMKIKLSKTGDASIVSPDMPDETKESCKSKEKFESSPEILKRTESPIGMKIKLTKTKSGASIISVENSEEAKEKLDIPDIPKRTESPLGMKIKLSKSGDASIVHSELSEDIKEKIEAVQDTIKLPELSSGMKIKVIRPGEMQESVEDSIENVQEPVPKVESPLGMKIKLSKFGDASIVPHEKLEQTDEHKPLPETPRRTESPLGMKIKLSKTGDASIIQSETSEEANKGIRAIETEHSKPADGTLGMKIKLLKTGDASIVDSEKKDRQQRRREAENPLEMKIKISKTGHPTIVACENAEGGYKPKDSTESSGNFPNKYKESGQSSVKEPALKLLKSGVSSILQSNRSELTIEPIQMQAKKAESVLEIPPKRKDVTISPVEPKKTKLEAQLTQMILPEVTIQPVASREQKQFLFDPKSNSISLQQMNVINQEISITQVRPQKPVDASMSEKLKDILSKNVSTSALSSDCEIIEHRPDLIIVNDNSNSSQDVMIIEELPTSRMPEVKIPKKRGRPRRNPLPQGIPHGHMLIPKDPLALDNLPTMQRPQVPQFVENERPKRTCRSQKSYAPPKRGRGRGRGKRKLDSMDPQIIKKPRIEQDLSAIETSTTGVLTIHDSTMQQSTFGRSPELYKALKQPAMDARIPNTATGVVSASHSIIKTPEVRLQTANKSVSGDSDSAVRDKKLEITSDKVRKVLAKDERTGENIKLENKDMPVPSVHANWLTPVLKRSSEGAIKHENVSTVQVIDEETRMSAESGSRSQTPARNISAPASETIVNEESQGSVLSTATTESEKVKVKNRRMEINFDPDEGPFTVEKIVEYEWPLDRKGETFMIQEQISQYLGVKSFKRKYPDLKRRVVDREERNYLRENGLVSEAMCDMGLTAICSSEVLDVMCSDFTDQYEEYRKHMREKQVKEHSKKQKELTAAATAEKNRIDLAEMAVQSALSWNISLNKARRENRKCSLDLQTFTIHVPKKQQKVDTERRIGHYPVALIPGQYTDYYREYTPAELRYYPLNTVLYGPMRPNERKLDSQSEGSQSDSDTDSSSDDSSSSSSEGTQDTEGSQSTMDEVDMDISHQKDEIKLKCKMCLKSLNKNCKNEVLIQCGTCNGHVHPSCIDLTLDMVPHIQSYAWQCTDCKTCAQCHDPADEDKMLFCDMCDRGYHIYCVGLRRVPQGRWHCQECAVCANCGSREPGGVNSDRNSVAQWQHEYKKGDKNTRVYVSTLCVPCSKLWRKGRYCPHCSRCHNASRLDLEPHLVHCSACDKYLHLGCVETKGVLLDRKNYLCDFCTLNHHHQLMKPFASKTMKT